MAKNNNLYCPNCGEKLWYSRSKKVYKCVNPDCRRSHDETIAERVARESEEEAEALKSQGY